MCQSISNQIDATHQQMYYYDQNAELENEHSFHLMVHNAYYPNRKQSNKTRNDRNRMNIIYFGITGIYIPESLLLPYYQSLKLVMVVPGTNRLHGMSHHIDNIYSRNSPANQFPRLRELPHKHVLRASSTLQFEPNLLTYF